MGQWGFYFNQDRCVGCKTCSLACKSWNDKRRDDESVNRFSENSYIMPENSLDKGSSYTDPVSGESNFGEYRKYFMKENWRRITGTERGRVTVAEDNTFESNLTRSYLSVACNHCDRPACMDACPAGVYRKDKDTGLVEYDNESCLSCGRCRAACPWSAPQYYSEDYAKFSYSDPARPKMTKCTGCLDRIREGLKPACVAACWNRALDAGPVDELMKKYPDYNRSAEGFSGANTGPNIIFRPKH